MKPHFRPFTRRDLFDVLNIELISYPDPWTQDVFESELEPRGFNYALVAEDKRAHLLIGYCFYWIISEDEIHINNIAVHPNYRRQGIALEMIRYVIDQGRPHDVKSVTLEVRESNERARELYSKIGFEQVGRRKRYYVHPKEDALILRLQIAEWDSRMGALFGDR